MIPITSKPAFYDEQALARMQEAFDAAWALTQSRYRSRTPSKDDQLRTYLSEAIVALAETGTSEPDELCSLALEHLPPGR
jgi:hypothetical protein